MAPKCTNNICMPYGRNRCAQDQCLCGFLLLSSEPVFRIGVAPASGHDSSAAAVQCGSSRARSPLAASSPCDWSRTELSCDFNVACYGRRRADEPIEKAAAKERMSGGGKGAKVSQPSRATDKIVAAGGRREGVAPAGFSGAGRGILVPTRAPARSNALDSDALDSGALDSVLTGGVYSGRVYRGDVNGDRARLQRRQPVIHRPRRYPRAGWPMSARP
jgi:hypothetical protein